MVLLVVQLAHHDVHDALELVHTASATDPQVTIDLLARLIPCEFLGYSEWDLREGPTVTRAVEQPAVVIPPLVAEARRELCSSYPLSIKRRSSETRALKISDFVSLRELHRSDYYDCVLRPFRIEHQMRLFLAAPAGTARVLSFSRRRVDGDFSERDRTLLELLRPFLVAVCSENGHTSLTERESEILRWVARGKTNREIAAILYVSPHTIRKHLEHAYEKLGVHTRTAAIARLNYGRSTARRGPARKPASSSSG
jgi:DNA-binding CsgD family transcriptional regulator